MALKDKSLVRLTADQRSELERMIAAGRHAAAALVHVRILLKADVGPGGPGWADDAIAEALECSAGTVARVRKRFDRDGLDAASRVRERFVERGFEACLRRKPQAKPSRERTLDGAAEAKLIALACSDPPGDRAAWTMRLLADRLVELEVVAAISDETVRRAMKKTPSSCGGRSNGASRAGRPGRSSPGWRT